MPDPVVVDASAILDAASPGTRFDAYSQLSSRCALTAPTLLAYELGSVVHGRRAALYGRTIAERTESVELLLAGIDLDPTTPRSRQRAGEIASRWALTFYDASYLELAERDTAAALVTQDKALLAAARKSLGTHRGIDLDGIPEFLARLG